MTEEEKIICKQFLNDADKTQSCNEYKLLMALLEQELKTGHWIEEFVDTEGEVRFTCSCCGKYQLFGTDFCYNCGAKMEEVEDENVNKRSI